MGNDKNEEEGSSSDETTSEWSDEILERARERADDSEQITADAELPPIASTDVNQTASSQETHLTQLKSDLDEDEFDLGLPSPFRSNLRKILEWVAVIGTAFVVAFVIKAFLFQAYYIPSPSMDPSLEVGDRVIVNKLSYKLHDVNRGDTVVFDNPSQSNGEVSDLIKRVVALPGETLQVQDGKVYIDGNLMIEPYLADSETTGDFSTPTGCIGSLETLNVCVVPDDHVFVMGDNRWNSRDSRIFGPVPVESIVGRAFVRVWPLGDFKRL
ncbi:MAG: Signal peptidase IB [Acidimicrobiales bacterium AG-410-I20]|nr:MAG: Signal peptidase IB [Acidimicrobiales bacterium AG-410-I20]